MEGASEYMQMTGADGIGVSVTSNDLELNLLGNFNPDIDPEQWTPSSFIISGHPYATHHPHNVLPPAEPTHGLDDFGQAVLSAPLHYNTGWMYMGFAEEGTTLPTQIGMVSTTSPGTLPNTSQASRTARAPPKEGLGRESWTPEQDSLIMTRRREGKSFAQIADEMRTMGVATTENRLVKRQQKLQDQHLEPLPEAVKNAMPKIMACIKGEMEKMDLEDKLGKDSKDMLDQIMQELPRAIPKFVQNRVTNKRKTWLNTSLTRN